MSESSEENTAAAELLADLVYTGVGLGILALNRLQVARRSVEGQLRSADGDRPFDALGELLADPDAARRLFGALRDEVGRLDDRLDGIEDHLAAMLDRIEPELPAGARELIGGVRTIARDHAGQLRAVLGLRGS